MKMKMNGEDGIGIKSKLPQPNAFSNKVKSKYIRYMLDAEVDTRAEIISFNADEGFIRIKLENEDADRLLRLSDLDGLEMYLNLDKTNNDEKLSKLKGNIYQEDVSEYLRIEISDDNKISDKELKDAVYRIKRSQTEGDIKNYAGLKVYLTKMKEIPASYTVVLNNKAVAKNVKSIKTKQTAEADLEEVAPLGMTDEDFEELLRQIELNKRLGNIISDILKEEGVSEFETAKHVMDGVDVSMEVAVDGTSVVRVRKPNGGAQGASNIVASAANGLKRIIEKVTGNRIEIKGDARKRSQTYSKFADNKLIEMDWKGMKREIEGIMPRAERAAVQAGHRGRRGKSGRNRNNKNVEDEGVEALYTLKVKDENGVIQCEGELKEIRGSSNESEIEYVVDGLKSSMVSTKLRGGEVILTFFRDVSQTVDGKL